MFKPRDIVTANIGLDAPGDQGSLSAGHMYVVEIAFPNYVKLEGMSYYWLNSNFEENATRTFQVVLTNSDDSYIISSPSYSATFPKGIITAYPYTKGTVEETDTSRFKTGRVPPEGLSLYETKEEKPSYDPYKEYNDKYNLEEP